MSDHASVPNRLVPDEPFPPYAYVRGKHPHPVSDPAGHLYGRAKEPLQPLDPACWWTCRPYLFGIDLFNHGYFWEAHEAWEGLWLACGRTGPVATLLKGLIKLAAAGCKLNEERLDGVRSHARRAGELFRLVAPVVRDHLGLRLGELVEFADLLAERGEGTMTLRVSTPSSVGEGLEESK